MQILPESKVSSFGQALAGFGQGALESLGEQIPKRMEERRLSQGLEALNRESGNMSPSEYLIRLESIPGVSPETKRQLGELKRQENVKAAYTRPLSGRGQAIGRGTERMSDQGELRPQREDVRFANLPERQYARSEAQPIEQQTRNVSPSERMQPQINPNNPLREQAMPVGAATPEQRNVEIGEILASGQAATPEQAMEIQQDNDRRRIEAAEVEQKRDAYLDTKQRQAKEKLTSAMELKLQKSGPETFKDITGEMQSNIFRGMEKDLRENKKLSVDDVVNDWTNRALNLAKAKGDLLSLASKSVWALPILTNKEGYRNKLEAYRSEYERAGNSEEFFKTLQSKFGMSPQGAAYMTYKPSKNVESYVQKIKPQRITDISNFGQNAREAAVKIGKSMTPEDSPLAIAYRLRQTDPNFDQNAYFSELLAMKDELALTPRQMREIGEGADLLPNWADFLILPFFRK